MQLVTVKIPGFGLAEFSDTDMAYAIETLLPTSPNALKERIAEDLGYRPTVDRANIFQLLAIWCDGMRPTLDRLG